MQQSLSVKHLNVWYGAQHALKDINIDLPVRQITAIIGPSGCGKSTFLKTLNRLLELNESVRIEGKVMVDGQNIYDPGVDVTDIRTRIGLLAQKPFPLPMSIYDNVAYGMRIHGIKNGSVDVYKRQDLPSRVHVGQAAHDAQAHPRPAGRHPVGRLWSVGRAVRRAACARGDRAVVGRNAGADNPALCRQQPQRL